MKQIKSTAIRKVHYSDLSTIYENPIEHACDVEEGDIFISTDAHKPEKLC